MFKPLAPPGGSSLGRRHALEQQYHRVWLLVRENFLDQSRLRNWREWEHKFDGYLNDERALKHAVTTMLRSLGDDYTYAWSAPSETGAGESKSEPAVTFRMLSRHTGYVRVSSLASDSVAEDAAAALSFMPTARCYVLDLRGNRGGLVSQSRRLFALFCESGKFGTFVGRQNGKGYREDVFLERHGFKTVSADCVAASCRDGCLVEGKPLAILVDGNTRSAAEMLAGALRDNGRALIVGARTYGKGMIQKPVAVGAGVSVKVVTAQYLLPRGGTIHGVGLVPDVAVPFSGRRDRQLEQAAHIVERLLARQGLANPST